MMFNQLPTPSLLLNEKTLFLNTQKMKERSHNLKVKLRPHFKTAKSLEVLKLAQDETASATVSTIEELEFLIRHQYRDIIYAVSIVPQKLERILPWYKQGHSPIVITDSLSMVNSIEDFAAHHQIKIPFLVEIDCGAKRCGVLPEENVLKEFIAKIKNANHATFKGLLTHAGHSYHAQSKQELQLIAKQEVNEILKAKKIFEHHQINCEIVSIGSTPTAYCYQDLSGVTEIRPGVYVFHDLTQFELGVCAKSDIAISILATVISHNKNTGTIVLDAGALALSKDISTQEFKHNYGYGEVIGLNDEKLNLCINDVHQEHGLVKVNSLEDFTKLSIGSRVRILPIHACMTVAHYDNYRVVDQDKNILWKKIR